MSFRFALGQHLSDTTNALYFDDDFVVVNDAFPKAVIHWLVLPKDKAKNLAKHPIKLLRDDAEFYAKCKIVVEKMELRAAKEFAIKMNCTEQEAKPWIKAGMHASPSMAHMHIHIISKDLHSPRLKRAIHYTSFATDFFVPFDKIPMLEDHADQLNASKMESVSKKADLVCWQCKRNFGRQFAKLKPHIEEEYAKAPWTKTKES